MEYIVLTAPNNGETEAEVREAVTSTHPEYRIERVVEKNGQWHVRLAADDEESGSKPPFPPKKKDNVSDDAEDSDSDSKDEGEKEETGDKPEGDSAPKDPVAQIKSLLSELQKAVGDLSSKADKVDKVKDVVKDEDGDGIPDAPVPLPEDVGPTPGSGPAAAPAPPAAPKRPGVPGGKRPGGPPAGLLPTFTNRRTHIVEHPLKDDEGEYTLAHVEAAIKAEPQLKGYKIAGTQTDDENNVYRVKLVLAE